MKFGLIHRCWSAAAVSLWMLLSACGGGSGGTPAPSPPTVSNLVFAPTVAPAGSGTVTVNGSLDFADNGGDVSSLTVTIVDAGGQQVSTTSAPIQGAAGQTSGSIVGAIQVATDVVGIYTVHVSISDATGARSNELSGTFQVVAVASQATVVSATGPAPRSLTAANGLLYWSESGEDALKSAPVGGGGTAVRATKMTNPVSMTFAGSDVIWLDDRGFAPPPGTCSSSNFTRVLKRTAANGTTRVLASGPAQRGGASDVVVIGGTAYWVSSTVSPDTWVINATPVDGGTTTTVATSSVDVVALIGRAGILYWMENHFATTQSAIRSLPSGGSVATIASGFDSAVNTFAVDGNAVYYTTPNYPRVIPPFTETLVVQPLLGGAATALSSAIPTPLKLVATGMSVAWLDTGALRSIPSGGGSVTPLASMTGTPIDALFDGTNILWTESTGSAPNVAGALRSVSPTGGVVTTLYEGPAAPRRMAIDPAARITWTAGSAEPWSDGSARIARLGAANAVETVVAGITCDSAPLVVTATDLIVADPSRIKRIPLAGGMPETVAMDDSPIANLTTDGVSVYWNTALGSIRKAPIAGGAVTMLVTSATLGSFAGAPGPIRIAPNGNLYWVANATNVLTAPSAAPSTSVTPIAQGLPSISDLVVDASRAYVAQPTSGDIVSIPLAGGAMATLAHTFPLPTSPFTLALDGSTLFWFGNLKVTQVPVTGGPSTEVMEFDAGLNAFGFAVDADNVYFTQVAPLEIRRSAR